MTSAPDIGWFLARADRRGREPGSLAARRSMDARVGTAQNLSAEALLGAPT